MRESEKEGERVAGTPKDAGAESAGMLLAFLIHSFSQSVSIRDYYIIFFEFCKSGVQ